MRQLTTSAEGLLTETETRVIVERVDALAPSVTRSLRRVEVERRAARLAPTVPAPRPVDGAPRERARARERRATPSHGPPGRPADDDPDLAASRRAVA